MMFRRSNRAKNGPVPLPERSDPVLLKIPGSDRIPARVLESAVQSLQVAILVPTRAFGARELEELVVEYPSARGRVHLTGTAVIEDPHEPDLIRVQGPLTAEVLQERDFVRVSSARPVLVYMGSGSEKIQSFTVDLSGGGLLLAGPDTLQIGERIEFRLTVAQDAPPIKGVGTVVRIDARAGAESLHRDRRDRQAPAGQVHLRPAALRAPPRTQGTGPLWQLRRRSRRPPHRSPAPWLRRAGTREGREGREGDKGRARARRRRRGRIRRPTRPARSPRPRPLPPTRAPPARSQKRRAGRPGRLPSRRIPPLPTHGLAEACLRALVAGTVCYVVAWGGAVFIWRRLIAIELKGREMTAMQAARRIGRRRAARSG